jgi:adenylate kinase family enzyme
MLKDRQNIEKLVETARELDMNVVIVGESGYGKTTQAKLLKYKTLNEILLSNHSKTNIIYKIKKALGIPYARNSLKGMFIIIDDIELASTTWNALKMLSDYTGLRYIVFTSDKKKVPKWILEEAIEYNLKGITSQEELDFFVKEVMQYEINLKYEEQMNSLRYYKQKLVKTLFSQMIEEKKERRVKHA